MSRHGAIMTCSWCKGQHYNSAGCPLKKVEIRPSIVLENPIAAADDLEDDEPAITRDVGQPQGGVQSLGETMLSQLLDEASKTWSVSQDIAPLPDSTFISQNRPVQRPIPVTTASKAGKELLGKKRKSRKQTEAPTASKK
ncbi:hypothetical protein PAHAL_2G299300 [Panicum hallii]|nr:uncharacterized protein LOC112879705 isoform X2 [Panicum hallii]PAN12899.1 hypothetical protein PAHAL_2G299300 [Panicum hallii]